MRFHFKYDPVTKYLICNRPVLLEVSTSSPTTLARQPIVARRSFAGVSCIFGAGREVKIFILLKQRELVEGKGTRLRGHIVEVGL